jgi:hypothetical protein
VRIPAITRKVGNVSLTFEPRWGGKRRTYFQKCECKSLELSRRNVERDL